MTASYCAAATISCATWVWRIQAWASRVVSWLIGRGQPRATSLTMSTPWSRRLRRAARSKQSVVLPTPCVPMKAIFMVSGLTLQRLHVQRHHVFDLHRLVREERLPVAGTD